MAINPNVVRSQVVTYRYWNSRSMTKIRRRPKAFSIPDPSRYCPNAVPRIPRLQPPKESVHPLGDRPAYDSITSKPV